MIHNRSGEIGRVFLFHTLFQLAPVLVSVISMPWAFNSSRMRSASAKFLAFLASYRCIRR